ncbi:leishmanolysin-like peptidase isoform X2 [Varroa jacobsoni]|uniref:Leishmanolysin-like peptidase n=2 Tax=Varroa TaxID=62624 RepID=A0A7M7K0I9_VARDE|nr:leishmanolysin-like peptidase isoform X1 [Varroa destructor]XP_022659573.1 leishmanolysin-like peptidase isoform X1 [Varroa destructor]XP_022698560.1 leishmanolysin-like peptidase isoform X2 [Varroa jacobsoni]
MLVGSSLWGPLLVLAGVTAVAHSRSASNLIATAMGRASAALHARGDHICSYKPPRLQDPLPPIDLGEHRMRRRKRRHEAPPLRIRYFYHNESISRLDPEKFRLINERILPQAVEYWSTHLRPRYPLTVPARLNRRCPEDKVFFVQGDPTPFCRERCEAVSLCGEVPVPAEHLGPCRVCNFSGLNCQVLPDEATNEAARNVTVQKGVPDADFVLYVSAIEGEKCTQGETIAYAVHCQQETDFDRPIAGHANLCPSTLLPDEQHIRTLLSTVKHEVLHALGFSVSLFAFFRDDDGKPLSERITATGRPDIDEELMVHRWNDRIVRSVDMPWLTTAGLLTKKRYYVVTPRVQQAVREHFRCSDLIGAELEDQGDDGTRLTHWEKRLFENEAMTGTNTQNPAYSRITFALMEDTGWYWASSGYDPLQWGRNLGCNFTNMSCYEWMRLRRLQGQSPAPYCDSVKRNPLRTTCTATRSAVALCNLVHYLTKPLPKEYRFFEQIDGIGGDYAASFGGSVALADYCPFVQEFTWQNSGRNSDCSYETNQPDRGKNFALERYGQHSACFDTGRWKESTCEQVRHWQSWGSACYQYRCHDGLLEIILSSNASIRCLYNGQKSYVRIVDEDAWLHTSHIVCPACEELCSPEECRPVEELDLVNAIDSDETAYQQSLKCYASPLAPSAWLGAVSSLLLLTAGTI